MYWENLQQMQEGATSTSDYSYTTYAEPQTAIAETPLPALKDVWPTHQSTKMSPTAQYDPYAVSTTVPTTYTTQNYYERNDTTQNYVQERNDHQEEMPLMYVDGRPVTITTNETDHEEPIQETHITEVEITSPDYIDYSRLGPSAKDIVVDGKALLDGFSSILNQMQNNYEALKADNNNTNSEASTSEICQLQIDGLPLSQLFQSFLPHLQNGGGQKMMEQYQQLSAQLSREKCMSFLQTMQQQQQQQQPQQQLLQQQYGAPGNYPVLQGQGRNDEKTREEVSLFDLHETAETLINLAKYPVEKKAVVVEMIPQSSSAIPNQEQNYMCPQNENNSIHTGYGATSQVESYPVDHFEFTKEDKELMAMCAAPMDPKEAEFVDKLIDETFENVEKTKFISDEVAAAIPDIQRKFLVSGYWSWRPEHKKISFMKLCNGNYRAQRFTLKHSDSFRLISLNTVIVEF